MVFSDTTIALLNAVEDAGFGIDIKYPNDKYEPDTNPYLDVHIITTDPEQATLGDTGCDRHDGILQIDINYRQHEGRTELDAMADLINATFKSGASFAHDGTEVRIANVGIQPLSVSRGWATIIMNIEYFIYSQRV